MTEHSSAGRRPDAQEANDFITVREAARRLGVSTSTVYRLPREASDPFRIFNLDRHVLVDRIDFERHLAARSALTKAAGSHTHISPITHQANVDETVSMPTAAPATAYCGQRDLPFPTRRPFVVIYMY